MKNEPKIVKEVVDFAKSTDAIHLALAVEFLMAKCNEILENQESVREQYANSIFSPDLIIETAKITKEKLGR